MNECLDHIIWACDDLERGAHRFEALTGISAQYGGVHASGLTHNALVKIGARCYLEILAPTGPPSAADDGWTRLAHTHVGEPRVLTYCLRSSRPLTEVVHIAVDLGAPPCEVLRNGRVSPEGVALRWQWVAPSFEGYGLAFPFFIDWLDSPHPATAAQTEGIELREFSVGHPRATELQRDLTRLGASVATHRAATTEFRVHLNTPRGIVQL